MEIKKVQGAFPEEFEKLRGGTFINLHPTKVISEEENDNYEYYQYFTTREDVEKVKVEMICQIYKEYLDKTDHKFYADYEPKPDETPEDLENIRLQRSIARTFIRANEDV